MMNQATVLIDKREYEDIVSTISKNAASYTPEWQFSPQDSPDIGTVIGLIYANQVKNNIDKVNQTIDRYHMEFVNLLDISVMPASPAESMVVMDTVQSTIPGIHVKKGTRIMSGESSIIDDVENSDTDEDEVQAIFETTDNVYITSAKIDTVFMADGEDGTITPILGTISAPEILHAAPKEGASFDELIPDENDTDVINADVEASDEAVEDSNVFSANTGIKPFVLFKERNNISQNAIIFYHSCLFEDAGNNIFIKIKDGKELIDDLKNNKKRIVYPHNGVLESVEKIEFVAEDTIRISKAKTDDIQEYDGKEYSIIGIVDDNPITKNVSATGISFSANGDSKAPEFVGDGNTDLNVNNFKPFGEVMSPYSMCYIGCDSYFKKKDARLTMSFDLLFDEKEEVLTVQEVEMELKAIKKKPVVYSNDTYANVYAQEIIIEYYNGIGWKKLRLDRETAYLFADAKAGHLELNFKVPQDMEETSVGSYIGRIIRIQLLKADNSYMRPAYHHYPIIKNMKLAFTYGDKYVNAERMVSFYGTTKKDITLKSVSGKPFNVFSRAGYDSDELYMGLSAKPESGPVTLFIQLKEITKYLPLDCIYEYSTSFGFKTLKAVDETMRMTRSGVVSFIPPSDFAPITLEGYKKYWIRLRRSAPGTEKEDTVLPTIINISLNGIRVRNIDTVPEREFFLDVPTPNARFDLDYPGILDAKVWVNEIGTLSNAIMEEMLQKMPERTKAEYDIRGNITAFYVLWDEVERFDTSKNKRVYRLDRLSSELIFGNGIDTDIPRTVSDTAVKVSVRLTKGAKGNVKRMTINNLLSNVPFIGSVYNPIKSYGGYDMETVDKALERGANIISSRRRLVSMKDYINEISSFSDQIDQVVGIKGYNALGQKEDGAITFLLLLKDFMAGSYSFHHLEDDLKNHLMTKCEMTVPFSKLYISEPIFVKLSVMCWLKANHMQDTYEIKNVITDGLLDYFNPLRDYDMGWNIGMLPSESQVQMKIDSIKQDATISNMTIITNYTDTDGTYEMHLKDIKVTPFMVCIPGEQVIHVQI